ncbi:probable cytochrome P450 6a23 [Phlebotomus papatasi]|uniref:probable cytochrome P450 6a23 n=1 Tax=Phlebotomus papatasi TaxID=29031 RepID=UPI0024843F09|nr:probable cytochrome P450 6a23 [Phlebotomus papatasi]
MEWLDTVFTVLAAFAAFYFYVKHKQSHWEREGLPYIEPMFLLGIAGSGLMEGIPFKDRVHRNYKELKKKGKFGGLYMFTSPSIMICDPDLVKAVLVKDFHHFEDRGFYANEKADPLSAHLLSLTGNKWKNLRAKLTPTFTSGRMKLMFPIIIGISQEFERTVREQASTDSTVEIKDLLARFTTDVIGNCAFGLECNSLKDPNTEFRQYGILAFKRTILEGMKQLFLLTFPKVGRFFNMSFNDPKVASFYMKVVRETVAYREQNSVQRNDFMNLLIDLKNNAQDSEKLTFNELAAQAFIFFLAGFETSSTTMMYCLYELALNPDIQEKTREHINHVLQQHNNEFTYEAMMDMTYLEQVVNETLRKYPVLASLLRICTEEYKMPNSNVTIKPGMRTFIPIYGFHHDPQYYPNPDKFDPDRFTKEALAARPQYSFIPFGEGPRVCIGQRFAMMQVRVGLVALLRTLKFSPCAKTEIPIKGFSLTLPFLILEKGIHLKVEKF